MFTDKDGNIIRDDDNEDDTAGNSEDDTAGSSEITGVDGNNNKTLPITGVPQTNLEGNSHKDVGNINYDEGNINYDEGNDKGNINNIEDSSPKDGGNPNQHEGNTTTTRKMAQAIHTTWMMMKSPSKTDQLRIH